MGNFCKKIFVGVVLMLGQIACGMDLPSDMVFHVMQYGDTKDYRNCALVCKQWHTVSHAYQFESLYWVIKYDNEGIAKIAQLYDFVAQHHSWHVIPIKLKITIGPDFKDQDLERFKTPLVKALAIFVDTESFHNQFTILEDMYHDVEHHVAYKTSSYSSSVTIDINMLIKRFPGIKELTLGALGQYFWELIILDNINLKPLEKLEWLKIVGANLLRMKTISSMVNVCPSLTKLSIIDSQFMCKVAGMWTANNSIKELELKDVIVTPMEESDSEKIKCVFEDIFTFCLQLERIYLEGFVGTDFGKERKPLGKSEFKVYFTKLKSLQSLNLVTYFGVSYFDKKRWTSRDFSTKEKCSIQ
jgi:F-box domain.